MHLFYRCHKIKHVLDELKHIFNSIFEKNIVLVEENLIIGVYEGEITEDILLMNLVICILKWVIWKTRNYIKYKNSTYREAIVITNLQNELRSNIQMMIKNQKFETYIILGNYSYYWIHYEFSCINNSFHCLLCKNVCL